MNDVHKYADEPDYRPCFKENESRVGTDVSELLWGEVGISALVSVKVLAVASTSHKSNANGGQNPSGNVHPQRGSCSRDGCGQGWREHKGKA